MTSFYQEVVFTVRAKPTLRRSSQEWGTDFSPWAFRNSNVTHNNTGTSLVKSGVAQRMVTQII